MSNDDTEQGETPTFPAGLAKSINAACDRFFRKRGMPTTSAEWAATIQRRSENSRNARQPEKPDSAN